MMEAKEAPNKSHCGKTQLLGSGFQRETSLGLQPLPTNLMNIVRDYLSSERKDPVRHALIGEQPLTLWLSQDAKPDLWCSWSLGLLTPDHQVYEPSNFQIDKRFLIKDHQECFEFLATQHSNYCRIVIDTLVVNLNMTTMESPNALSDLRNTRNVLRDHLNSVKNVVFSVAEYAFFCFSVQAPIEKATGLRQLVDNNLQPLDQIIDDLDACWKKNYKLAAFDVFEHYFTSKDQPVSQKYLTKLVISMNHPVGRELARKQAFETVSKKIMRVFTLRSFYEARLIDQETARRCHFIDCKPSFHSDDRMRQYDAYLDRIYCHQDNHLIERIVIEAAKFGARVLLPRPRVPLSDFPSFSALIELKLNGYENMLRLTDLNSGFFPYLKHLTVTFGKITGHLDSFRVPRLKTLRLAFIEPYLISPKVKQRIDSCVDAAINADRPWQLLATQNMNAWSLASYENRTTNPQYDGKEDHAHLPPLIKELLLVGGPDGNSDEWRSQLKGEIPREATLDDHKDHILMWTPECVQKITACGTVHPILLDFSEIKPGQLYALTSLTCYYTIVVMDGIVLPELQELNLNHGEVTLSGFFSGLQKLSFDNTQLKSPWKVDAPLLQSLDCQELISGPHLSLNPQSLPQLSFLRILIYQEYTNLMPNIVNDEGGPGFSRIQKVVLGERMKQFLSLEQCRVNEVSDLALVVSRSDLPKNWRNWKWDCETLSIFVDGLIPPDMYCREKPPIVVLPAFSRVKKLKVTSRCGRVLLNTTMPHLSECTVNSPNMLGAKLRCPALRSIRFTDRLSGRDKERCLNPALYRTIGARPKWIYFEADGDVRSMDCDSMPNKSGVRPLVKLLDEVNETPVHTRIAHFFFFHPVGKAMMVFFAFFVMLLFHS